MLCAARLREERDVKRLVLGCILVLAVAICGCGKGSVSPEHLGTWTGAYAGSDTLTVEVSGGPGDYAAKLTFDGPFTDSIGGTWSRTFERGRADERGNVTFKSKGDDDMLTLGPVESGQMTAYLFDGSTDVVLTK